MKNLLGIICFISASGVCAQQLFPQEATYKYRLYPIRTEANAVWLLNVETGSIAKCTAESVSSVPQCSPWTIVPPTATPQAALDMTKQASVKSDKLPS